jgi:hypothetical protein
MHHLSPHLVGLVKIQIGPLPLLIELGQDFGIIDLYGQTLTLAPSQLKEAGLFDLLNFEVKDVVGGFHGVNFVVWLLILFKPKGRNGIHGILVDCDRDPKAFVLLSDDLSIENCRILGAALHLVK